MLPVSSRVNNATSTPSGHLYSSKEIVHSLQDPHQTAIEKLEDEANKAADLHHVGLLNFLQSSMMIIIIISLFKDGVPNSSRLINANHFDAISPTSKTE